MKNTLLMAIIVAVIAGAGAFYGGIQYQMLIYWANYFLQ